MNQEQDECFRCGKHIGREEYIKEEIACPTETIDGSEFDGPIDADALRGHGVPVKTLYAHKSCKEDDVGMIELIERNP